MANPQPDKFTKISNELLDALAKIRIAGEARQMLDVIIRKTYGFNKKEDKISTSQFIELTGLSRIAIPKARRKLLELNLITVSQKGYSQGLTYSIQKDYNKWKPYPKKDTVSKKGYRCIPKRTQVYPKKDTNCIPKSSTQKKERQYTKETIQKTYSPTSKEVRLSTLLLDLILNRKPNFRKPDIQKWSLHINRLLNIDNRTSDEIEKVIKWCQEDDFWCVNILSTEKLRKQIDKLEIKMNNKPNNKGDNYGKIKQHSEGYPEGTPFDE